MKSQNHFGKIIKASFLSLVVCSLCSFAYFNHLEEGKKASYKKFLSEFEQIQTPIKINFKLDSKENRMDQLAQGKKLKTTEPRNTKPVLGDEFGSFIPSITRGRMSRLGPSVFRAEVLVATTKKYNAVIYSKSPAYRGSNTYILATYDAKGKEISKNYIGHAHERSYMNLTINKELELVATAMVSDDNMKAKKVNYFAKSSKKLFIADDGTIIEKVVETKEKEQNLEQVLQERLG